MIRSIGYRGVPLGDVPFDERRGLIRNDGGRVCERGRRRRCAGEYVVGWIKRGPSGVIGTNKKDAADTVARIVEDAEAGRLPEPSGADAEATGAWLRGSAPGVVEWDGWQAIDEHEQRARRAGRPPARQARARATSSSPPAAARPRRAEARGVRRAARQAATASVARSAPGRVPRSPSRSRCP